MGGGGAGERICDYRGVSVRWLKDFAQRVLSGQEAVGIELVLLKEAHGKGRAGDTARVLGRRDGDQLVVEIPYVGQQAVASNQVTTKLREAWETEDVCEYVVKGHAEMMRAKQFFIDVMDPKQVGSEFQGAFVSQARRTPFQKLVAAVVAHYESAGTDLAGAFVWLDIFGANQPHLCDPDASREVLAERNKVLSSGLHEALSRFDDMLVFFDSWRAPKPLTRAWCVWELYGAARFRKDVARAPLQVIFEPAERERFIEDGLIGDYDSIQIAFSNMRVKDAACYSAQDKAMIDRAIELYVPGQHTTLDANVAEQLHAWLAETALEAVQQRGAANQHHDDWEAFAELLDSTGRLLDDEGELDKALEIYERALEIRQAKLGQTHTTVADTLNRIAVTTEKLGRQDKALETYEQALKIRIANLGPRDPGVADMLNNMAGVISDQGKLAEALVMYEQALDIKRGAFGDKHTAVAETLNNMASVMQKRGELDKALAAFEEALDIYEEKLGPRHTFVASTLNNMAGVVWKQGKLDKALEIYERALQIKKANLGPRHPGVASTLNNMAFVREEQHKLDEALENYEQALAIYAEHQHTRDDAEAVREQVRLLKQKRDVGRPRSKRGGLIKLFCGLNKKG
jgi:tetratricopeptide (TPR) repeat protein